LKQTHTTSKVRFLSKREQKRVLQLEVNEAIGDADGIATVKSNIATAKSKYEGWSNTEELLKACQEMYTLRVTDMAKDTQLKGVNSMP
jgi:copper chaperone CopZ